MTEEQEKAYYGKFPSIIRELLANQEIAFPDGTQFDYEPIWAYRVLTRKEGDYTPLEKNDMKSYYELKKRPRGRGVDERDPEYYAVSLNKKIEVLENLFKFPNPKWKLAYGQVYKEGGPQFTKEDAHVSWWLFDNVDFSGFIIKEREQ